MEAKDIIEKAKKQLSDLTGFTAPAGIGLKQEKGGWLVTCEITEKKSIPEGMDLIGTYDVHLSSDGRLTGYEKIALRKRMDTESFEAKEEE